MVFFATSALAQVTTKRWDAYTNLTGSTIAADDEWLIWDTSAVGLRNVIHSELVAKINADWRIQHEEDFDPCTAGEWSFGVDETTGAILWCDGDSTEYTLGPIDDTAGQSETNRTFSANKILSSFLGLSGGTLTGFLTLHATPTADYHAATKEYVDAQIDSIPDFDGSNVSITGGSISGVTLSFGSLSGNGVRGYTYSVTAGEALAAFDVVAIRNDGGTAKAYKYRCASADSDKALLAIGITTAAIDSAATGTIITDGLVRNSGWDLAAADTGKTIYASTTDGLISTTIPSSSGDVIQAIGRVVDGAAEIIYLRPSMDYGVIQ